MILCGSQRCSDSSRNRGRSDRESLEESYDPVAVQTEGEEPEEQESNDVAELNSKGDKRNRNFINYY